ncbi:hypothetical protein MRX96_012416 [Rhipicephalus microplus]|uniref:Putative microplusin n=1 Tax=Rhipicephalus microplus TaxID=6941 RepID=A0A6M2D524_RHIMP
MKVLLLCGLFLAGAFVGEAAGGKELCALSKDKIKEVLKCMVDHAPAQVKSKALEILTEKGDHAAELIKKKCESDADFGVLLTTVFSEKVANAVKTAYGHCKPASG